MKACRRCGEVYDLSEYYTHPRMADGHLNVCKRCTIARVTEHRERNLLRVQQYDRDRSQTPKRQQHLRDNSRKMNELYPERRKARSAVSNALRDGRLFKQPCVVCGESNSEAHHPDYTKPLEVVWLCKLHHEEVHKDDI